MKNKKDRIICVSKAMPVKEVCQVKNKYKDSCYSKTVVHGYHTFYYEPEGSTKCFYLFSTKRYSPSIAAAFAERGVLMSEGQSARIHSITVGEFYRLMKTSHHNFALNKVLERIPSWINDAIRYELTASESFECNETRYKDEERAA